MTNPAIKFKDSGRAINQDELLRCEQELQLTFPAEYRELLQMHNGGRPTPAYLPLGRRHFLKVERLLSIAADAAANEVVSETKRLRAAAGLMERFAVVAKTDDNGFLFLDCEPHSAGMLYTWLEYGDICRFRDPDFDNVFPLFPIGKFLPNLGTKSKRGTAGDPVAEYSEFWSEVGLSEKARRKMEDRLRKGFDINQTLPDRPHPIFGVITREAFDLVAHLLMLGVKRTHKDGDGLSILERLQKRHSFWTCIKDDKSSNYRAMARRHLKQIEAAMAAL